MTPDHRPASQRLPPVSRSAWLLMIFPLASALFSVAVLLWMSGFTRGGWGPSFEPGYGGALSDVSEWVTLSAFGVAVMSYNCVSQAVLVVVIAFTSQRVPRGMAIVALGCLVHTIASVAAFVDMVTSDSSTTSLGALFIPLYLILLVAPCYPLAEWWHRRRTLIAT